MYYTIQDTKKERTDGEQRVLEIVLVAVILVIMCLLMAIPQHKFVILYLYFLPVSFSGFLLGRYRAGVTALLCVLVTLFISDLNGAGTIGNTLAFIDILSFMVWGAALGLTAILIGTLSDERARQLGELYELHKTDTLKDALTKVANRRAFEYEITRRLSEWHRQQTPFALIMIDIDHFKKFNDTYGHQAGDAVLRGVAQTLEETMRESDLVARYGGEEIAVILPNSSLEEAKEAAERARLSIEASRFAYLELRLRLTVSVGVAQVLRAEDAASLVQRTDAALYSSKQAGRNCSHVHNGTSCELFGAALPCRPVQESQELVVDATAGDAFSDRVTGLPSRKVFIEELRRRVAEAQRYTTPLSVMLIEIDGFDDIQQDEPVAGQKVLSIIGEFVRDIMRDSDLVARHSLSQFAVLMPATMAAEAIIPAERLRVRISQCQKVNVDGKPLSFTVSIGLAEVLPEDDAAAILERGYAATQAAKKAQGNLVYRHTGTGCKLAVSEEAVV